MMHHPNMHHHQPMSGHPPQHIPTHQGMPPGHQHVPPHAQMHRENRHVTLTRVPMGPGQAGGGMGHGVGGAGGPGMHSHGHGHGQAMGGLGAMPVPHHQQRPPHSHPIRAMPHHPPAHNHSVPPQQMKPMRRPYLGGGGGYGSGGVMYPQPDLPPDHASHSQPHHTGLRKPMMSTSSPLISPPTKPKISSGFGISSQPNPPQASSATSVSETAATGDAGMGAGGGEATGAGGSGAGSGGAASEAEAGRAPSAPAPPANSKEKTPMCLVNELARYNKIKHQYRLTSETGPAHKKVFTVTLRLGDTEEYTAEGSSIKRAQHAAAQAALAGTGFPPPPPRAPPAHAPPHARHAGAVMPTVELNALAMKLCQPAVYTSIPPVAAPPRAARPRPPPPPPPYRLPPFMPNAYQRMLTPGLIYRVRVSVGGRAWLGEGATPQAARHDAAARALQDLRPPPDQPPANGSATNNTAANAEGDSGEASAELLSSEVKSPVSLVHELALKRNLSVVFTVKSERGPPHMRVFVTKCTVGEMETEGEGNGKKVSKRRAAELMLGEMRRRWPAALLRPRAPPAPGAPDRRRPQAAKKKPRNLIKEGSVGTPETNGNGADNPISRLAVARHAVRARSPQYRVLEERGAARRREFLVQCDAPPHSATGLGPNKKTAKRRAAHNVLVAMEMASAGETNGTATTNSESATNGAADASKTSSADPKRKEGAASPGGASCEVRQPVPGVLLMDYHQRSGQPAQPNGLSETSATGGAGAGGNTPGAKDQLMYLSQLLGFTVQFSDFPKRNHGEYLSLVSLSTEPPVMCHGGGPSTHHSHEQCARAALRALTLMGLDAPAPSPAPTAAPQPNMPNMPGQTAASKAGVISNGITE